MPVAKSSKTVECIISYFMLITLKIISSKLLISDLKTLKLLNTLPLIPTACPAQLLQYPNNVCI